MSTRKKKGSHKKKGTRKVTFSMDKPMCSPALPGKNQDFTCYTDDALIKLRDSWNDRHQDDKIILDDPADIWSELKDRYSRVCDNERCWLRQKTLASNLDRDILEYTFAPRAPMKWKKNPNEWLTSTDLSELMAHYERRFPSFSFIGPTPIDFDSKDYEGYCVWDELCNFSVPSLLNKRKTKIGIIFNTDPHTEDGEHWISMFVDLTHKQPYIFFFDSNGDKPPDEVKELCDRIIDQCSGLGIDLNYEENHPFRHQKSDSECGMYSLFLIIKLLTKELEYNHFKKNRVTDKDVENLRSIWFDQSHF